jgi:hypothetical protein
MRARRPANLAALPSRLPGESHSIPSPAFNKHLNKNTILTFPGLA